MTGQVRRWFKTLNDGQGIAFQQCLHRVQESKDACAQPG